MEIIRDFFFPDYFGSVKNTKLLCIFQGHVNESSNTGVIASIRWSLRFSRHGGLRRLGLRKHAESISGKQKVLFAVQDDEDAYLGEDGENYHVMSHTMTCTKAGEGAGEGPMTRFSPIVAVASEASFSADGAATSALASPLPPAASAAAAAIGFPRAADRDPWHQWGSRGGERHHRRLKSQRQS